MPPIKKSLEFLREKAIGLAREMFLTPNERGDHKFSFSQIAHAVHEAYPQITKHANKETIFGWCKRENWYSIWGRGRLAGVANAIEKDRARAEEYKEERSELERNREKVEKAMEEAYTIQLSRERAGYKIEKMAQEHLIQLLSKQDIKLKELQLALDMSRQTVDSAVKNKILPEWLKQKDRELDLKQREVEIEEDRYEGEGVISKLARENPEFNASISKIFEELHRAGATEEDNE